MPRPATGPRRIDSSGTWYAVKVIKGTRHTISLGTKIKAEAHRKWPAAQAQLEAMATPQKLPAGGWSPITEYDPDTGAKTDTWDWNTNLTQTQEQEDPALITWARAEDVAARRYMRRKGKEVSRSWQYQILNAKRHLPCKYPLEVTTKDVRMMVDRMEEQGYKASTIAQRTSALSGLLDALIKGGYAEDTWANPFERVDTHGISTDSFYKATPEDYQWVSALAPRKQGEERHINTLKVLIYTGARISEVIGAFYEEGWMIIKKGKNRASIRDVPLPDSLKSCMKGDISSSDDSFRRWFNKRKPNPDLTPHSYRHGFKSAARVATADELTVERLLGHTIPKMLLVYGEYPKDVLQREAVKVQAVIREWCIGSP